MPDQPLEVPEDRPLTWEEREMLRWLLAGADERGQSFLAQVDAAHVVSRCGCGCASIEFSINGKPPISGPGLKQLSSDYYWNASNGGLCGIFVYAKEDQLAGLEVWSVDGKETPTSLPAIQQLRLNAVEIGGV